MKQFFLLLFVAVFSDELCESTDGVERCKDDCSTDFIECQTQCQGDTSCLSSCNRDLAKCESLCPCSAENCLSGCPCPNKYCSTFQVEIEGFGVVEGKVDDVHQDVVKFLGIPYAEPPERFYAAKIKKNLGEEVFDAKKFGQGRDNKLSN